MAQDALREQAWHDTLSKEELADAERVASMPPSMAIGFVYVEMKREMKRLVEEARRDWEAECSVRRGGWRGIVDHLGAGMSGGVLAYFAASNPQLFGRVVRLLTGDGGGGG